MAWLPKKNIVVPIDFSGNSLSAIATAIELSGSAAGVHVIHVMLPLDTLAPGAIWGEVTDQSREESIRTHYAEHCQQRGIPEVELTVKVGDPGSEITDFAGKTGADLIVIPSHGFHGLKRFVLGSVAERVIRHAECDVLVERRPDAD